MRYAYVSPQSDLSGFSLSKLFKKASKTLTNLQPALQQVAAGNYAGAAQSALQTWATGGSKENEPGPGQSSPPVQGPVYDPRALKKADTTKMVALVGGGLLLAILLLKR